MWPKKKPKKYQSAASSLAEMSARVRQLILDSQIQHAHEISTILGCPDISDEVADREEEESDKRVDRIAHLIPLLYAHARTLAEGTVEYQRGELPPELKELPDEIWWDSRKLMQELCMSVLLGSISQLVDLELLEIPKEKK